MQSTAAAIRNRAAGAIMGALIGDALGMGVHWYYDLDEMHRDHGDWVTGYRDPVPGRYHDKLKAGDLTQSGVILKLTLQSLVRCGGYSQEDYCRMLDEELLAKMDGTSTSGPGGYTNQSIRHVYAERKAGKVWAAEGMASLADSTEAVERTLAMGVLHAQRPDLLARDVGSNTLLTQCDPTVACMTVAFNAVLALLVRGHALDANLTDTLMQQADSGELPVYGSTGAATGSSKPSAPAPPSVLFPSPDALIMPSTCAAAAKDPNIKVEPAWRISIVYGMPCAAYHVLPACYYLGARFSDNFEEAVLQAVNGGGQNCARAMLTGALVGAQVGLSNIPKRFIDGLTERDELLKLAETIGELAAGQR